MPSAPPAQAGQPDHLQLPSQVVTPSWLADHLGHPALRILDVRSREAYDEGHIPGAIWTDLPSLSTTTDGVRGMLLPPADWAARLGELGVDPSTAVVAYDDNWGLPSSRVVWAFARYGFTNAAVLTGGADRWQEEERPWTDAPSTPRPTEFIVHPIENVLADRDWLLAEAGRPDLLILDTRSPNEFAAGSLPGAVCWDWMNGVPTEGWDTFKPADVVRPELAALGITPDKEVVTYCQSGVRAAHTYLLLRQLGFPRVRLYDGSWLDWSLHVVTRSKAKETAQ